MEQSAWLEIWANVRCGTGAVVLDGWWYGTPTPDPSIHSVPGANTHTSTGHLTILLPTSLIPMMFKHTCGSVNKWGLGRRIRRIMSSHNALPCLSWLTRCHLLPSPKTRKKYGHCHCHQLKASHKGTCPIACFLQGMQYDYSQCPVCVCTCDAFVILDQNHEIVSVSTLPQAQICNQDSRASARSCLKLSMNVNW